MFQKLIEHILEYEGGYSNHPQDAGGETKFGITKKLYLSVRPNGNWDNFSINKAKDIYKDVFYHSYLNDLPPALQLIFLDTAVNHGQGKANRMIQSALGVVADGHVGEKTIQAMKTCDQQEVIMSVLEQRKKRMLIHPLANGLISRLFKLQRDALNLYWDKNEESITSQIYKVSDEETQ